MGSSTEYLCHLSPPGCALSESRKAYTMAAQHPYKTGTKYRQGAQIKATDIAASADPDADAVAQLLSPSTQPLCAQPANQPTSGTAFNRQFSKFSSSLNLNRLGLNRFQCRKCLFTGSGSSTFHSNKKAGSMNRLFLEYVLSLPTKCLQTQQQLMPANEISSCLNPN